MHLQILYHKKMQMQIKQYYMHSIVLHVTIHFLAIDALSNAPDDLWSDLDLIYYQQGKISSGMFADINNPSCLLFHKHARKS